MLANIAASKTQSHIFFVPKRCGMLLGEAANLNSEIKQKVETQIPFFTGKVGKSLSTM